MQKRVEIANWWVSIGPCAGAAETLLEIVGREEGGERGTIVAFNYVNL